MKTSFILFKIFSLIFLLITKPSSSSNNCTNSPLNCGLPEFNLSCIKHNSKIHFPSYGDLIVKSISYDTKRLNLFDPKNCVHEVFLNLNLSSTPFKYYYDLKMYKYINCSEKITSFDQIPCLSGYSYYVYTVESSFLIPGFCRFVKSVEIPFSYSSYISDNSFGLGLTWDSKGGEVTKSDFTNSIVYERRLQGKKYFKVSGIIALFLFLVGILFYTKREILTNIVLDDEVEVSKFQGEYEALNP